MENPDYKVRVELRFIDCKHRTVCEAVLASDDVYSLDHFLYQAISQLGLHPESNDEFEIISFKVFSLRFFDPSCENLPPLDPNRFLFKL